MPLVLVENERTAGGHYDHWQDITGELYHFPNKYKNKVITGERFVYYRGARRATGRGPMEYFGVGRIGEVWPSDKNKDLPKKNWQYYCRIEDYQPFLQTVARTQDDGLIETIAQNSWGDAVRDLPIQAFERITLLGGVGQYAGAASAEDAPPPPVMPPIEEVTPVLSGDPLIVKPATATSAGGSGLRRSKRSTAIGRRAEQVALKYLEANLGEAADTLRWVANEGKTPGWDIEYRLEGCLQAVEVKGTTASRFVSVEMTAGELDAANLHGERYFLVLVANCTGTMPSIQVIQNPASMIGNGFAATVTRWRLTAQ